MLAGKNVEQQELHPLLMNDKNYQQPPWRALEFLINILTARDPTTVNSTMEETKDGGWEANTIYYT